MPPEGIPAEANAMGNIPSGMTPKRGGLRGMFSRSSKASLSSNIDVSLPKVDALSESIDSLITKMSKLREVMLSFSTKKAGAKMAAEIDAVTRAGTGLGGGGGVGTLTTSWARPGLPNTVKIPLSQAVNGAGGAPGQPAAPLPRTSPASGDIPAATSIGQGVGNVVGNLGGAGGLMAMAQSVITGIPQIYGALAGGSLQYTYNRINGPQGNMNAMTQLAQALAPNVTMMHAAGARMPGGGRIGMQGMIEGLAQQMPIMGTQQDMLQTILAGQSVGALMAGTPGRGSFFESARQAQVLMPGQAPGQIAGNIAGYIGNTRSQQMGVMMGEGAFTMIGQGGSYKTLAEWAHGITEFLKQHRPGGMQGKSFGKDELITQNFPGSNINAWFQMMGVPQGMVDYWWQYVLTAEKGPVSEVTSRTLQESVTKARGINLGYEQLRTATQSTRRDFLFGNQMYGMYAANASANRRFNVTMQGTDQQLAAQLKGTNIGRMIALLPTPILEMLMPILTQFFSSPAGGAASMIGGLFNLADADKAFGSGGGETIDNPAFGYEKRSKGNLGGDLLGGAINTVGNVLSAGAGMFGDPGWGDTGGTNLAHLSPDLARKVGAMMAANPNLRVTSGYRDTGVQNRLRRGGAGVSSSSRSAHTRGWAVDLGPASQMGWLNQNAGRFGLQTASGYGEPWHIQQAGTPLVGDPGPSIISQVPGAISGFFGGALGDIAEGIVDGLAGFMMKIMTALNKPIQELLSKFIGSGSYISMIDSATELFSKMLTAPMEGMTNIGGKAEGGGLGALINQPAKVRVPVIGSGFTSSGTGISSDPIFGDPMGPGMMASTYSGGGSPVIVFQAPITISGGAGSGLDARRLAVQLATHLEEEVHRRQWLVS